MTNAFLTAGSCAYRGRFVPGDYLRKFYPSSHLPEDDVAIFREMRNWLRNRQRSFGKCLEVGCGPTVGHLVPLAPCVRELHLSDYLPENLAEVRRWLNAEAGAFDWDPYIRHVLRMEGSSGDEQDVLRRKTEFRRKVVSTPVYDLGAEVPAEEKAAYDLVTSFYCVECSTASKAEWRARMGRLASLARPGGSIFLAALRDCRRYAVGRRWFPCVPVGESDIESALRELGFGDTDLVVRSFSISEWREHGFDGICVAHATRAGTGGGGTP